MPWQRSGLIYACDAHPGRDWALSHAQCPTPDRISDATLRIYFGSCAMPPTARGRPLSMSIPNIPSESNMCTSGPCWIWASSGASMISASFPRAWSMSTARVALLRRMQYQHERAVSNEHRSRGQRGWRVSVSSAATGTDFGPDARRAAFLLDAVRRLRRPGLEDVVFILLRLADDRRPARAAIPHQTCPIPRRAALGT